MYIFPIDGFLEGSYITGPIHNTLQLRLTDINMLESLALSCLPPRGDCIHEPLQVGEIRSAILEGVARANKALGTSYSVEAAGYVANDTPKYVIYTIIAYRITIMHHAARLHVQVNSTGQRTFDIVATHAVTGREWQVDGRAWADVAVGDVLFVRTESTVMPFEVTHLSTYGADVPILERMLTGSVHLRDILEHGVEPKNGLFR